jgi:4-amino-4-deoxy-L-arabinose transferase-like glycosyltransferase
MRRSTSAAAAPAPAPTAAPSWREGGRALLALLLVALALKLAAALTVEDGDLLAKYPTSDAQYYVERARGLLGLQADPLAHEPYHLPPLYPWVLASVPGVQTGSWVGVRVLQALAGTLALAGVYRLARRRLSRTAALVAVGLVALYAPLTFYETRLLGDSLAFDLLVGLLVAADALADRGGAWRAALVGALTGLVCLLRPQALLLVPALAVWAATLPRRPWLPLLLAAAATIAPATLHNWRSSGEFIVVSDNGGVNLWLANTGPVSGTFTTVDPAFGDIAMQSRAAQAEAESEAGRPLQPGEVSSWLSRAALAEVAAHPGVFLQRVGQRALALIESFETDVTCFPAVEIGLSPVLRLLVLPFGVLLGLWAAAGWLGARLARAPRLPALAVALMVVGTALLFFHYSRFRLPLVPLLAIGGAATWDRLRAGPVAPGRIAGALVAGVGVAALSLLPAPHHATTRANGWTSIGNARLSNLHGRDVAGAALALAEAERALAESPGFVRAELLAARACLPLGRLAEAQRHVDAVLAAEPDYPQALVQLALIKAIDAPDNPHRDPAGARALLARLRPMVAQDPSIAPGVELLEQMLR